jgi:hypothetical protein
VNVMKIGGLATNRSATVDNLETDSSAVFVNDGHRIRAC